MTNSYPLLFRTLFTLLLAVGLLAGCDDSTGVETSEPLETLRIEDVAADPSTSTGGGRPTSTGRYTLVDLQNGGEIVLRSSETDRSDSTSADWDIGFQSVNIIFNGGDNGPGEAGGQVLEELFADVTEAPESGYEDSVGDWYTYNANGSHLVRPIPGRTIVVRTADGEHYAKLRIVSYYEGAPDEPGGTSRYYTFEYVLQEDGSRDLSND